MNCNIYTKIVKGEETYFPVIEATDEEDVVEIIGVTDEYDVAGWGCEFLRGLGYK